MCGIVGAVSLNSKSILVDCAKPMADSIAHRGPDDAGYLFFHTGSRHYNYKLSFFQNLAVTYPIFLNGHSRSSDA